MTYSNNSSTVPSESPKNLQATEVTTNSVTLNWDAPPLPSQNGAIIGYTVQVFQEEHITSILASRETSLAVTKLDDDTTYDFSVAANTSVGAGPYSVRVTAKTKNYGNTCSHVISHQSVYLLLHTYTVRYSCGGGDVLTDRRLFAVSANTGLYGVMCCLPLLGFKAKAVHFQMV